MSVEALLGTDRAFAQDLIALRAQPGQAVSAANLRRLLDGSPIVASHREDDPRVQDAYSLRCAPQVNGAARDALGYAEGVAKEELRSAIDNPMVLPDGRVESCGNFHGAPLALACDLLAMAVADTGAIAERRTDRLLDASRSEGLPPFLAEDAGVDSGLMIAQYTQAAMAAENRRLAAPASVDSLPTWAMQEDHVSMGWGAARKLRTVVANLRRMLAVRLHLRLPPARSACPAHTRRRHRRRARRPAPGGRRPRPRTAGCRRSSTRSRSCSPAAGCWTRSRPRSGLWNRAARARFARRTAPSSAATAGARRPRCGC